MKNGVLNAAGWVLVGMILMGLLVWFTMPSFMLIKHKSSRGYDDTVAVLSDALEEADWRVLTVNDYQKSTAAALLTSGSGPSAIHVAINSC
jgi:hypothetical protein